MLMAANRLYGGLSRRIRFAEFALLYPSYRQFQIALILTT